MHATVEGSAHSPLQQISVLSRNLSENEMLLWRKQSHYLIWINADRRAFSTYNGIYNSCVGAVFVTLPQLSTDIHAMPVTLANTIGAAYIGIIFSAMYVSFSGLDYRRSRWPLWTACSLFGITNVQTYIYYLHYSRDWMVLRFSVSLQLFQVASICSFDHRLQLFGPIFLSRLPM